MIEKGYKFKELDDMTLCVIFVEIPIGVSTDMARDMSLIKGVSQTESNGRVGTILLSTEIAGNSDFWSDIKPEVERIIEENRRKAMAQIKISGHSSLGLIEEIGITEWTACEDGNEFEAIEIAGHCLLKPFEEDGHVKCRVTVTNTSTGNRCSVDGFYPSEAFEKFLCDAQSAADGDVELFKIAGQCLSKEREDGQEPYSVVFKYTS